MEKEFELIDEAELKKIVCSHCNKFLNVPPIFCLDQATEICGRCIHILSDYPEESQWRQFAYEKLAKLLTYPCVNKEYGCDIVLRGDKVKDHENICNFQCIYCPFYYSDLFPGKTCSWKGKVKMLDEHIEHCHKDSLLNPPQFEWVDSKCNNIFFTHVGTQLITVAIKFVEKCKYYCLLMINGSDIESQCFRYQLELIENKNNSIILRKNRLESIGNMLENMKNYDKMLKVDLKKVMDMLGCSTDISGRFGIVRKNKKEIKEITGSKDPELVNNSIANNKPPSFDEKILQELECPICNEHMLSTIFVCESGHSICVDCKSKVVNCPNCRAPLSGTRNYTLENLSTKVYYPCRNREIGCSVVTTSQNIRVHEKTCELSENPCILRCGWNGLRPAMYKHLMDSHSKSILETNTLHIRDVKDKKDTYYILYVNGELFRVSIKGTGNNSLKFNVQHLGMVEGEPQYQYQLQIVDQSHLQLNLSITNICQCITDNPNTAHSTGISFSWDLLKPFIFENSFFYYKITIKKI